MDFNQELECSNRFMFICLDICSLKHLRMLIVSAWGNNDITMNENIVAIPRTWGSDSIVGLWATYKTSVVLQLRDEEAMELWEVWSMGAGLGNNIRDHIFELPDRQHGLLTHVID